MEYIHWTLLGRFLRSTRSILALLSSGECRLFFPDSSSHRVEITSATFRGQGRRRLSWNFSCELFLTAIDASLSPRFRFLKDCKGGAFLSELGSSLSVCSRNWPENQDKQLLINLLRFTRMAWNRFVLPTAILTASCKHTPASTHIGDYEIHFFGREPVSRYFRKHRLNLRGCDITPLASVGERPGSSQSPKPRASMPSAKAPAYLMATVRRRYFRR